MKRRFKMLLICSLLIALCGCGKVGERGTDLADNTPAPTATQQPPTEAPAVEKAFRALDYVTLGDYYDIWLYANRIGMDETGMSIITYEFFSRRAKAMNLNIVERTFDDVLYGDAPDITDEEVRMLGIEGVEDREDFEDYVCRMVNGLFDTADYLDTEDWFMGRVVENSVIKDIPDEKVKEFEAHYREFFEAEKSKITPEELEVLPNCMYEDEEYTTNCAQKVLVAMAIAETEGMEDFSYKKVVDFLLAYAETNA